VFNIGEKRMKTQKKSRNIAARIAVVFTAALLAFTGCQQTVDSGYAPDGGLGQVASAKTVKNSVKADTLTINDDTTFQTFVNRVNGIGYPAPEPDLIGVLMANIDISGITGLPIGNAKLAYEGTFGAPASNPQVRYTLSGLNVSLSTGFAGLFAVNRGTIQNIEVDGTVTTTADSEDYVGGIVGYNGWQGTISNVIADITVTAGTGIVGSAKGCFNVGGIAGFNGCDIFTGDSPDFAVVYVQGGTITHCINKGTVRGAEKVGGIVGENAGLISECGNMPTAEVTGITNSTSVNKKNGVGGIAGRNGNNNTAVEVGTIEYCYNTAYLDVGVGRWLGGITGFSNNNSFVINCYDTGDYPKAFDICVNPIIGGRDNFIDGHCSANYSLDSLAVAPDPAVPDTQGLAAGIRETSQFMQSAAFVTLLGDDFTMAPAGVNNGYPVFTWQ
jgi:hypothetical protein